ncbi:Hypothetical predicted protein [Olea europaea subsp. europaea]|uniref:Uncharacterized protein n=1 Tax=Olea europaea subsp. europaea TaxID=158383 RepID=A0A8S0UFJ4_OLEEU|nr:Hypothetical predicted protein [Olea europaea subsp. europaea]
MAKQWIFDRRLCTYSHKLRLLWVFSNQPMIIDPPPSDDQTSTFQSNSCNTFSFQSILSNISTPSSSPTPNSTSINSSSTSHGDERESYGNNMLNFDMDVNEFMQLH